MTEPSTGAGGTAVEFTTDYGWVIRFVFMQGGEIDIDYREEDEQGGWTTFGSIWPDQATAFARALLAALATDGGA